MVLLLCDPFLEIVVYLCMWMSLLLFTLSLLLSVLGFVRKLVLLGKLVLLVKLEWLVGY